MVSIKDVAERAGVSVTTVSLVLNEKGSISQQTRDRVLEAVDNLKYKRNVLGRSLRSQQSQIIGYAQRSLHDAFNPVLDHFLFSMADTVEKAGWHVMLFQVDQADLVTPYQDLIESGRVDGFILSYTEHNDPRFHYLHNAGVPFVAFGKSETEMDCLTHWVDVDGAVGMYAATQHLIEEGYQHIGFVGWPEGSASGDSRLRGYRKALEDYHLPFNPQWVVRVENYTHEGWQAAQQFLASPPIPEAVVAVSDSIAIGALQAFRQAGVEVAITGFDDTPWAEFVTPGLTSVRQPIRQVASLLTDMLIKQIKDEVVEDMQYILKPQLIVRQSSLRRS